jgi:soluble lytic murein transglycosylase
MLRAAAALLMLALSPPLPSAAQTTAEARKPAPVVVKRDAAELVYTALLDEAIAGARDQTPSLEQLTLMRDAILAIGARDPARARELRSKIDDPAMAKLVDWQRLRMGYGEAAEYRAFLDQNPHWPDRALMTRRMDEALFTQGGSTAAIRSSFKGREPLSGAALAALASAALAEGDNETARRLASHAWRETEMPASIEAAFAQRFASLLSPEDHKWRLDSILIGDPRWQKDRSERAALARRQIARLPEGDRKKAEARLAVLTRAPNAQALMDAVPADAVKGDWGFVFNRIQLLRRSGKIEEAARLMLTAPIEKTSTVDPDGWWDERRALAYAALRTGRPQQAYDLVRDAGPLSVNPAKEQTFLAGWLSLRKLDSPQLALRHFTAMRKAADGPLSIAKSEYWLGRTREVLGDVPGARKHYQAAGERYDTFHGQLARQRLTKGPQALPVRPPAPPTPEEVKAFNANDAVRATVLARKAGLSNDIVRTMLGGLRNGFKTEAEAAMNAHLAEALGDTQMAVRIAKTAIAQGKNLILYGYPVHPFPVFTPLSEPPELAFLLAIARQESEFNTMTVSGAGAKGLLQVMTVTAKHVCRDYKMKCEIERLLTDKSYNAMIASAYISDRMGEFAGSYVLGMAGYNAGPGRARQWIREFGDPRDPKVDPIDWIERIPFTETREYVAKVLSNVQIYRARLGDEKALRLKDDLARARGKTAVPADTAKDEQGTAGGGTDGG